MTSVGPVRKKRMAFSSSMRRNKIITETESTKECHKSRKKSHGMIVKMMLRQAEEMHKGFHKKNQAGRKIQSVEGLKFGVIHQTPEKMSSTTETEIFPPDGNGDAKQEKTAETDCCEMRKKKVESEKKFPVKNLKLSNAEKSKKSKTGAIKRIDSNFSQSEENPKETSKKALKKLRLDRTIANPLEKLRKDENEDENQKPDPNFTVLFDKKHSNIDSEAGSDFFNFEKDFEKIKERLKLFEGKELKPKKKLLKDPLKSEEENLKGLRETEKKIQKPDIVSRTDLKFIDMLTSIGRKVLKEDDQGQQVEIPKKDSRFQKQATIPTEKKSDRLIRKKDYVSVTKASSATDTSEDELLKELNKAKKRRLKIKKKSKSVKNEIKLKAEEDQVLNASVKEGYLRINGIDTKELWSRNNRQKEDGELPITSDYLKDYEFENPNEFRSYRELKKLVNDELIRIRKPSEPFEMTDSPSEVEKKEKIEKPEKIKPGHIIVKPNPTSYLEKRALQSKNSCASLTDKPDDKAIPRNVEEVKPVSKNEVEKSPVKEKKPVKDLNILKKLEKAFYALGGIYEKEVKPLKNLEEIKEKQEITEKEANKTADFVKEKPEKVEKGTAEEASAKSPGLKEDLTQVIIDRMENHKKTIVDDINQTEKNINQKFESALNKLKTIEGKTKKNTEPVGKLENDKVLEIRFKRSLEMVTSSNGSMADVTEKDEKPTEMTSKASLIKSRNSNIPILKNRYNRTEPEPLKKLKRVEKGAIAKTKISSRPDCNKVERPGTKKKERIDENDWKFGSRKDTSILNRSKNTLRDKRSERLSETNVKKHRNAALASKNHSLADGEKSTKRPNTKTDKPGNEIKNYGDNASVYYVTKIQTAKNLGLKKLPNEITSKYKKTKEKMAVNSKSLKTAVSDTTTSKKERESDSAAKRLKPFCPKLQKISDSEMKEQLPKNRLFRNLSEILTQRKGYITECSNWGTRKNKRSISRSIDSTSADSKPPAVPLEDEARTDLKQSIMPEISEDERNLERKESLTALKSSKSKTNEDVSRGTLEPETEPQIASTTKNPGGTETEKEISEAKLHSLQNEKEYEEFRYRKGDLSFSYEKKPKEALRFCSEKSATTPELEAERRKEELQNILLLNEKKIRSVRDSRVVSMPKDFDKEERKSIIIDPNTSRMEDDDESKRVLGQASRLVIRETAVNKQRDKKKIMENYYFSPERSKGSAKTNTSKSKEAGQKFIPEENGSGRQRCDSKDADCQTDTTDDNEDDDFHSVNGS